MSGDEVTKAAELRNLIEEYEATYPEYQYEQLTREKPPRPQEPVAEEFVRTGTSFLRDEGLRDTTYERQILAIHDVCEQKVDADVVAETVGCSIQYARRFTYDPEIGAHEKDWSKSTQREKVSPGMRTRIMRRDGDRCLRCGAEENLEVHHIRPVGNGGTNDDSNLATLCERCHIAAHGGSKTVSETAYPAEEFDNWVTAYEG